MKVTKSPDTETIKAIRAGRFKDHYLIYNRKSTDETENQKSSIQYQRAENLRACKRDQLPVASVTIKGFCTSGVISEKHSGFKESDELEISDDGEVRYRIDRPKFHQMVQHLNAGHFKGILCLSWDRLSRNKADDTIVRKLMRRGVDVRFAYARYDRSSSGELHMDIDGMFSQHHSRVTSEKVAASIRQARSDGKCTYRAPIGYLNTGSMEHKPLDNERAPIVKNLFELYATGDWSLSDLAAHAAKQGLQTVPVRKRRTVEEILADETDDENRPKLSRPLSRCQISRILTNPFYTGKVIGEDGVYVPSTSHEALVSDALFMRVQSMLKKRHLSVHYTDKLDYPFRGFVRCALCQRVYTPYLKKGHLYYSVHCVPGCKNTLRNCKFEYICGEIGRFMRGLSFTEAEVADLESRASTEIALLEERRLSDATKAERTRKRIRDDLAYLRTNQLALLKGGAYSPESLADERSRLEEELDQLAEDDQISEQAMRELMQDVIRFSELLDSASLLYEMADPHEKVAFAKIIVSELRIAENVFEVSPQFGFEPFVDRSVAISAPIEWLSELLERKNDLQKGATQIIGLCAKKGV